MSYLVNKTNGELIATLLDGQTNTSVTSITLIGKQVTGYGELQNENFLHILENFANSVDPIHPIAGQLWWNTASNTMQVYTGSAWRPVTGFTAATTAPNAPTVGDQWWDTTNDQFKIYAGTDWAVVGPAYSKLDSKTGALVENIYDTGTNKHSVIKLYHNNNVTAIISRDPAFTPNVAIDGFTTVSPGITFSSNVANIKLHGTATNADTVNNLTTSQFMRTDTNTGTTGTLSVEGQLHVGQNSEFNVTVDGLGQSTINSNGLNKTLNVRTNINGSLTTALSVNGSTGLVTVIGEPTDSLGVATKSYTDTGIANLRSDVVGYIAANVNVLENEISALSVNQGSAAAAIAALDNSKAPKNSPVFTGIPTAPTPLAGDASANIATTAFVTSSISSFDTTKIYNGSTNVKANLGNIELTVLGSKVLTVTSAGLTTATQAQNDNSTNIATTAYVDRADKNYVLNSVRYQPTCYISNQPPNNSIGANGDLWFQYV
jgi:hypothetical protein